MSNLLKINLKPLIMLLFTAVILSVNMIITSNLISENVSESIVSETLRGNPIETLQDSEKISLSDVQTTYNVSETDITEIPSNRNKQQLSNEKSEVLFEDGNIITSLESIYEQLDLSISDQEINKLVKIIDSKVEVIIGFHSAHRFSYRSYSYHLHTTNAQLERELPKLNAIVLEVPISFLKTFMSYWQALETVRYVEVAQVTSVSAVVNDLNWSLQYGPQIIQADLAWDIQIGDPVSILVAVIDTGVDYNHPDLVNQYVPGGYDYVNGDNDPMDDHSHGTHCAGVIGATINNSIGIAGIANVSIMAIKVFDSIGYGFDYDAASAIIDATDAGADVLSNSYGFPSSSTTLEDAVTYATTNDVVIVVSAGNDGSSVSSYPALYPETIVVSATDDTDTPASFTNYGSAVDVAAPGVAIWSTIPVSMGSYGYMSGTSMACPHVAAVCALIRAEFPTFTTDQVRQHLRTSAEDLGEVGWDDYYGYGRINAFYSVQPPPEHELVAYLFGAPSAILPNTMIDLDAVVYNYGQNTEVDVDLQLWIEDIKVDNQIFTSLAVGENGTIEYSWTPSVIGVYNITVYAVPVTNEPIVSNNKITKMVDVTWSIIDYNLGDFIEILWADNTLLANFTYLSDIDPTHVHVDYGDGFSWLSVNTLTRLIEDGNLWVGAYYLGQIETDINVGNEIKWLSTTGTVDGTVYYDWNGMILEAWNVSIAWGDTYAYYHKDTGIWLYYKEWTGAEFFMNNTNMIIWQLPEHDVQVILETPVFLALGESTILNASVYNGGASDEANVVLQLLIDESQVASQNYPLPAGVTETLSYTWTPTLEGIYNVTAYAIPVTGETYILNNAEYEMVIAAIPTLLSDFEGSLSDWTWDGLWHPINDSQAYGEVHSPIYSMYYGQNDTGNYNNGSTNRGTLMSSWYELGPTVYRISFWSWYETEESEHSWDLKDVYLITTDNAWIPIGYVDGEMNTWVQFFFDISSYAGQTVRFAFVFDTIDSISNDYRGWYVDDVIILGSANKLEIHNVVATLNVPNAVLFGTSATISAVVANLGDFDETDVELQLWINDSLVDYADIPLLLIGDTESLIYSWTPAEIGYYNITVYIFPVTGEFVIVDNKKTVWTLVDEPLLSFELGDYIKLEFPYDETQTDNLTFTYVNYIDSEHVNVTLKSELGNTEGWMSINILTRMIEESYNAYPPGFIYPCQIETDVEIGNTINWMIGTGIIESTVYYDWNGSLLEAWNVNLVDYPGSYCYYHKETGIWLYMWDSDTSNEIRINDTNMLNFYAPIVTVTYPNGGETLSGMVTITWDASDLDGDVLTYSVYYWTGSTWIELVSGWPTTSYELDTTTVSDGGFYKVGIIASDGALTGEDVSDGSFTIDNYPDPPVVTVTYPNGGETVSGAVTITWDASDLDGDVLTYSVYFWDGGTWIELVSGRTTTSYEWDTTNVSDGRFYKARIVASDGVSTGEDVSDGSFTIDNFPHPPIVTVTYSNGGETLNGVITITWDASDLDGDVLTYTIYYWDGSTWIELVSGWSTTSYEWDTTTVSDGGFYKIRIVASDGALTGEDESDESFIIDNESNPTTTSTSNTSKPSSGFEVILAILIPLLIGLTIFLIRKKKD